MPFRLSLITLLMLLCPSVSAQTVTLYDVYALAVESDPRVRIAQHKVALSIAQDDGAFGQMLPQASFNASFSDNEVKYDAPSIDDQKFDGERYSIQVRQTLFNWRTLSSRARTQQVIAQREAELLDVMSLLLVDVSERYFRVLLADGDVGLIQAENTLVAQQLRETEERYERKLVRITDYLDTQARMDSVRIDLIEAENVAAIAREALAELTDSPTGQLASFDASFTLPLLENNMAHWSGLAMENNALLAGKHEAVLAAAEAVQEQKGGHYPTVDLVLSGQRSDVGYDNQPSPRRDTTYIGVDISIPLFAGGSTLAAVREAWSQYYIAREEEEATRRDVLKRVREAWLNTQSNRKRIDAAQLSVKSANKSYEAMDKSFSYGTVTAADLLQALHGKTRAQRDHQDALYRFLTSWLVLKRESGELTESDLLQLNEGLLTTSS